MRGRECESGVVKSSDSPAFDKAGQKFLASGVNCKGGWCGSLGMCVREQ
jgi:hypothetical protein